MVATTDPQLDTYRQEYADAGLADTIATEAADLRMQQDNGAELTEVQQQILDFAERGRQQQGELQALAEYDNALEESGFEQAGPEFRDRVPDLDANYEQHQARAEEGTERDWVSDRRVGLTAALMVSGFQPQTDEDMRASAQSAIATQEIPGLAPEEQPWSQEPELTSLLTTEVTPGQLAQSDGEQDDDSTDTRTDHVLEMAGKLVASAEQAGLTEQEGDWQVLRGDNLTLSRSGETTVISGEGRKLVGNGSEVVSSESEGELTDRDRAAISGLSELSPDELREQADQQKQLKLERQREGQRQPTKERTMNRAL